MQFHLRVLLKNSVGIFRGRVTHNCALLCRVNNGRLSSDALIVGALGLQKNNAKRRKRLMEIFHITADDIDRLHGPIGSGFGSKTPAKKGVSILAQIALIRRNLDSINPD